MISLSPAEAQKYVAMELVTSFGIIIFSSARDGDFPGASQFVPPLIVFAGLAIASDYKSTATTAAVIGAIILLMQLVRPTTDEQGNPVATGTDIAAGLGNLAQNIGSGPKTTSKGHK